MELVAPSGCRTVVETLNANSPAICFYESLGFVRSVQLVVVLAGKILIANRHVYVKPGGMGGIDLPGLVLARDAGGLETPFPEIYR